MAELVALRDSPLAHGTGLTTGREGRGAQGAARGRQGATGKPRLAGKGLVGVVFDGELEQAAGLLDQQVDLGAEKDGRDGFQGAGRWCWFGGHPGGAYLIQGNVADGGAVDLQDAVAHVDGVLHVGADAVWIHSAGPAGSKGQPPAPTPSRVGMCWDTAHEPPPANGDRLSCPLLVTSARWGHAIMVPMSHP